MEIHQAPYQFNLLFFIHISYILTTSTRAKVIQERLHSVQKNPVLKLTRFFPRRTDDEKERQFQNWNSFRLNGVVLLLS